MTGAPGTVGVPPLAGEHTTSDTGSVNRGPEGLRRPESLPDFSGANLQHARAPQRGV